jgi:hypothetical protein
MPQASNKDRWKENIINQSQSGLSIAAWCRQNQVAVHAFYYWRNKAFPKSIDRANFKEILEQNLDGTDTQSQSSGVSLQYQEVYIHLDRQFDASTFKQCLKIIMEVSC